MHQIAYLNAEALSTPAPMYPATLTPFQPINPNTTRGGASSMVHVSKTRLRHDPYGVRVTLFSPAKPSCYCATPQKLQGLKRRSEKAFVDEENFFSSGEAVCAISDASSASTLSISEPAAAAEGGAADYMVPFVEADQVANHSAAVVVSEQQHQQQPEQEQEPEQQEQQQKQPTPRPAPITKYVMVRFKQESATYKARFHVAVGDTVVVEADRGEHVGVVAKVVEQAPAFNVPSQIARHATAGDLKGLVRRRAREELTTRSTQRLVESIGVGLKILDSEYQSDGQKLTIYYSARVFVDFRKLQRSLFKEHRCRIWLVNVNEIHRSSSLA